MTRLGVVTTRPGALDGKYDDFWSFVLDAERPSSLQHERQREHHHYWLNKERGSWYGLAEQTDFQGVKALVRNGWPEGLRSMLKALGSLEIAVPLVSTRRRRQRSGFGDELDIHRVYSGDFDNAFSSVKRAPGVQRRSFSIIVDAIAFGSGDAESMFWRGAAAIKLGEILSSGGYAVELRSGFLARCDSVEISLSVVTKAFDAPMDLCSAAATMALPAFFRCVGHAWIHANLHEPHDSTGVGVRVWAPKNGEMVAGQGIGTVDAAVAWIKEQIAALELESFGVDSGPLEEKAGADDAENEKQDEQDEQDEEEDDDELCY